MLTKTYKPKKSSKFIQTSFLFQIFIFKIFFKITFFWFCYNSIMTTIDYLYFVVINKGFVTARINSLEKFNQKLDKTFYVFAKNF